MSRPKGVVFSHKETNLVYVLFRESRKNDGTKVVEKKAVLICRYNPAEFEEWRIFGIFENLSPDRPDRFGCWDARKQSEAFKNGIPEGKCIANPYGDKSSKRYYRDFMYEYDRDHPRRDYQRKLKTIKAKADELIALGIDKKAALQAARKCSCSH